MILLYKIYKDKLVSWQKFLFMSIGNVILGCYAICMLVIIYYFMTNNKNLVNKKQNIVDIDNNLQQKLINQKVYGLTIRMIDNAQIDSQLSILIIVFFLILYYVFYQYVYMCIQEAVNYRLINSVFVNDPTNFIQYCRHRVHNLVIGIYNESIIIGFFMIFLIFLAYQLKYFKPIKNYYYLGVFYCLFFIYFLYNMDIEEPIIHNNKDHSIAFNHDNWSPVLLNICSCSQNSDIPNDFILVLSSAPLLMYLYKSMKKKKDLDAILYYIYIAFFLTIGFNFHDLKHGYCLLYHLSNRPIIKWGNKKINKVNSISCKYYQRYIQLDHEIIINKVNEKHTFLSNKPIYYIPHDFHQIASLFSGVYGGKDYCYINNIKSSKLNNNYLDQIYYFNLNYKIPKTIILKKYLISLDSQLTDTMIKNLLSKYKIYANIDSPIHLQNSEDKANFISMIMEIIINNNTFVFIDKNILYQSSDRSLIIDHLKSIRSTIITDYIIK